MADEQKPADAAAAPAAPEVPPTEKPVPSRPVEETIQCVVTLDRNGTCLKVEKLEEDGKRTELQAHDYASLVYNSYASALGGPEAASTLSPLIQAYLQGYSDYINALTPPAGSEKQESK